MRHALPPEVVADPFAAVRGACARVAGGARFVRIDRDRIAAYAAELPIDELQGSGASAFPDAPGGPDALMAYVLTLDAINFGSGYFPHLRKRAGLSGYRTLEACLRERFERAGALHPAELRRMTPAGCAQLLGQSLDSAPLRELMDLFARALRDLGTLIEERYGGELPALVAAARGSGAELVRRLLEMPLYRDIARYADLPVPFLKRAQLSVADLARALPEGAGRFDDLDRLTAFADNLVPHVLRLDGVLHYEPGLLERIERGELLPSGAPEEVEIRACALHAIELLAAEPAPRARRVSPHELDQWLWTRGGGAAYKAQPRHRTRCPYY